MLGIFGVSKRFGTFTAVDHLSFSVQLGEVYGLLGPNGAGKTTTIRMISGLATPSAGRVVVNGLDVLDDPKRARRSLGVLLSDPGLYDRLTASENILLYAELQGLRRNVAKDRAISLLKQLDLGPAIHKEVGPFSKGMKQKVAIARAVIHDPALVVLDEPTVGLDVFSSLVIEEWIRDFRKSGRAVLFSTHIMDQVEKLCDRVCIVKNGRKVREGSVVEITEGATFEQAFVREVVSGYGGRD